MTPENKKILDRINAYAETALADIDPQKTHYDSDLNSKQRSYRVGLRT